MKKFVSADKMTKKQRKALNDAQRKTWGGVNPVTQKIPDKKKVNQQSRKWRDEWPVGIFVCILYILPEFGWDVA